MKKHFSLAFAALALAFSTTLFTGCASSTTESTVSPVAPASLGWSGFGGPSGDFAVAGVALPEQLICETVWKMPFGNGFGQIAVVGDKAFAFVQRDDREIAICFEAKTGKELWQADIDKVMLDKAGGDGPRSTPTIDGNRVYIYGTHMKLACLDLATGKELWSHPVHVDFGRRPMQWGNTVSPVVVDDVVIVTTNELNRNAKDNKHPTKGIVAYNKVTGELAWSQDDARGTHATPTVATILGKKQVICFMQSGLVSVEPKTGEVLWAFEYTYNKTSVAASPVVGGKNGDIVYCSSGYQMGAAACRISKDGSTWVATQLWRTEKKNCNHWTTPVHRDGYIYGLMGQNGTPTSDNGELVCLDIETGDTKWSKRPTGSQGGIILVGDKLLISTPRGELLQVAASPEAYKELGRQKILNGKNWTAPTYVNGLVFMRNTTEGEATAEAACLKIGN